MTDSNSKPAETKTKCSDYWFPAKKYGYGWGAPTNWKGWTVSFLWALVFFGALAFINPRENPVVLGSVLIIDTLILYGFCLKKGAPPKWRWGDNNED